MAQYKFVARILEADTKEILIGATAVQEGTSNGATADSIGKVSLNFSQTGSFSIIVSYLGYKSEKLTIEIPQKNSPLVIYLKTDETQLEEVVVSSVRTNSTIENIPTKIEVLGLEEVNEENGIKPGNIMSLLSDVAGIQMQQVSASSGNTYARIQGLDGRYTQILKDGLPLFGGMSGNLSIMQIPPLDLKQIEIIKGCGSTLYGADAIGGIINLISKNPQNKQELSLTLNQTTLLESNLNLYASKKYDKFGYTFFAGETFQKQGDIDKDGLTDVPAVNSITIHPKLFFYLNPKSVLSVNYTATFDNRKGGEMNYFSESYNNSYYHISTNSQRHSADINWNYRFSDKSILTAKFSNSYLNQSIDTKDYDFGAKQNIFYSEISYFNSFKTSDWVFGVNFNGDNFKKNDQNFTGIDDYNYRTIGLFAQNTWHVNGKLSIESGLREDYHSKYGLFTLPRLSFMYKFNKEFTGRLNGGLGYKIPIQFSYIDPETDIKNTIKTELKPEKSQGINADINYNKYFSEDLSLTVNQAFFLTNIQDPVIDTLSTTEQTILSNADKSLLTKGLQSYIRMNYKDLEVYLGYVYTDTKKNYDLVHPTPYTVPKHQFSTTFFYDLSENFVFGIESTYMAGQLDENYNKTKYYLLIAAMLRYSFKNFDFVLNGENLLDFRQNKYEQIYSGTINNPVFHKLWAPIDGRVLNLSVKWTLD